MRILQQAAEWREGMTPETPELIAALCAEVERLQATLTDMIELIVDLRASQAECYPEVKRARAALKGGKE